jgi:hypothetical protein
MLDEFCKWAQSVIPRLAELGINAELTMGV